MELKVRKKTKVGLLIDDNVLDELNIISKLHSLTKSEIVSQVLYNFFGLNRAKGRRYIDRQKIDKDEEI